MVHKIPQYSLFSWTRKLVSDYSYGMPKYKFDVPAPLDSDSAYSKVKTLLSGENDFKKFDPKVSYSFDEPNKGLHVTGSQFKANMHVVEKDAKSCNISVEVELPFTLALFKGKIQETIEKTIKKHLA